jgi:serine/threonine-protein kinase HipA
MTKGTALLVELQRPDGSWVEVGSLQRSDQRTRFEQSPGYWAVPDRPVLAQRLEEQRERWRPSANVALPSWFSHLLPEDRLRREIAAAVGVTPQREFDLLARIGTDDLPGAVRTRPTIVAETDGAASDETADSPLRSVDPPQALKFSLAGVQPKFSRSGHSPKKGLTVPASGEAGTWIVKLPYERGGWEGVPEAERAALALAGSVGHEVPSCHLVSPSIVDGLPAWATASSGDALAIARFDRLSGSQRVHFEELAQVLDVPVGDRPKYERINVETICRTVGALCGPDAVGEVIRRVVLNVLVGNGDAHAKNWAVRYVDGHTPSLSPVYDVVPTVLFLPADDLGIKLNGSRQFGAVHLASFDRSFTMAGWDVAAGRAIVRDACERIIDAWRVLADHLSPDRFDTLTRRRDALPLLRAQ